MHRDLGHVKGIGIVLLVIHFIITGRSTNNLKKVQVIDSTRRKISTPTIIPNKPFFPFYLPPSLNCGVPSPTTPISNSSLLNIYILLKEKKKHLIPYDQDRTPLKKLLDGKKIHSKGKKKKKGKSS